MSRTIVEVQKATLVSGIPVRREIGVAENAPNGEMELHFARTPQFDDRILIEADDPPTKLKPERLPSLSLEPLLRFKVSHQALRQLEELVSTGLYGATIQDAAREMLYLSLRTEALKMEEMRSHLMNRPIIELKEVRRPRKKKLEPIRTKRMRGVT